MNKSQILSNVDNLSAEQLFGFICSGVVTLEELRKTEMLDATKRRVITNLLAKRDQEDDAAWENLRFTESGCRSYIDHYPAGRHIVEAKSHLARLEQQQSAEQEKKREILERVHRTPNSFTPGMLNSYLKDGTITRSDLINAGIPNEIIDRLHNISPPQLRLGAVPESIPEGFTEVYFWGIPGSGKTCALSAILNTAETAGYLEIAEGPGFDYTTRLKNIFVDSIAVLPPPSPVETTQYLPFVLKKGKDKPRSVSLIELSGEIFQCFYHNSAGSMDKLSNAHKATFDSLIRFLKGNNRKIHFFFVDYEKENKQDADGYRQSDYLQAAARFFKNNDIFRKTSDAIYIVLTKSDLLPCQESERTAFAKEYLQNENFTAFTNSLKERCREHSINGGKLTLELFSLGKVYFQQMCSLDRSTSKKIIDILIDRISPSGKSLLDVFNR